MTPESQLRALAELDGWEYTLCKGTDGEKNSEPWQGMLWCKEGRRIETCYLPDYLNSRDAIVLLIEKQTSNVQCRIVVILFNGMSKYDKGGSLIPIELVGKMITATPSNLCEALLCATGKWKD